jgi:hypothetical protein
MASMMMNVIVGFVLLLIVAAVAFFLIGKGTATFIKSNECESRQGDCTEKCDYATVNYDGCKNNEVCCVNIGG